MSHKYSKQMNDKGMKFRLGKYITEEQAAELDAKIKLEKESKRAP